MATTKIKPLKGRNEMRKMENVPMRDPNRARGKWAIERREYLYETEEMTYMMMKQLGLLEQHLKDIQAEARDMWRKIVNRMQMDHPYVPKTEGGYTGSWAHTMWIHATADEIVRSEVIHRYLPPPPNPYL